MSALLNAHQKYIAKVKAKDGRVLSFTTPCCAQPLEDAVPNDEFEVWSTMAQCPHCDGLFFKRSTREHAGAWIAKGDKRCTCASNGEQYCRQHSDGMPRDQVRGS